jgi:hypothetical protein
VGAHAKRPTADAVLPRRLPVFFLETGSRRLPVLHRHPVSRAVATSLGKLESLGNFVYKLKKENYYVFLFGL